MGSLRADALTFGRFFIERRAGSIGTLGGSSQRKLAPILVSILLASGMSLVPTEAAAANPPVSSASAPLPTAPAPPETAPDAPPAPAPSSPFTGSADGSQGLPLPPPPPAGAPAPGRNAALPPAPPPRGAAAPPPGTPGNDLPPLPPPVRGVHQHDGFYLRLALGLAASGTLVSSDQTRVPNYSFAGGGAAGDLWLGGTPTPGLAMGGALSFLSANSTTRRVDGDSLSGDVSGSTALLGFFVDGFPDPERGFHFGGSAGLASARSNVKNSGQDEFNGGGLGLAGFLGYDMWVSPQWSLGGMVRFLGTLTRENRDSVNYQTSFGGASLSFTALYH